MSNADDGGDVAFNFQSKALSITAPAVWNSLVSRYEKVPHHHHFQGTTSDTYIHEVNL